jgi:hypothetical protein
MPMLPILISLAAWVVVMAFIAALCAMAAKGDRAIGAKAQRMLPPRPRRVRVSSPRPLARPRVH